MPDEAAPATPAPATPDADDQLIAAAQQRGMVDGLIARTRSRVSIPASIGNDAIEALADKYVRDTPAAAEALRAWAQDQNDEGKRAALDYHLTKAGLAVLHTFDAASAPDYSRTRPEGWDSARAGAMSDVEFRKMVDAEKSKASIRAAADRKAAYQRQASK